MERVTSTTVAAQSGVGTGGWESVGRDEGDERRLAWTLQELGARLSHLVLDGEVDEVR
eukprot:CAMPEP_0198447282 /NCGR_PEP_ID=MMETSP1453-20131121/2277_1 /TAXON_ID=1461543 ORGANISM="Unidentified sp., Strain RCC701" /NCGR_SAMPLE_ID=MMETSP1453 /ASSEMBLY_ACC=CAM_ASM_001118 /LENGTH=57 /DNA_ID=CAMNT_0044169023 /DNA_START=50 /DNA_END=220 /DNA_ORIENTATION=+